MKPETDAKIDERIAVLEATPLRRWAGGAVKKAIAEAMGIIFHDQS